MEPVTRRSFLVKGGVGAAGAAAAFGAGWTLSPDDDDSAAAPSSDEIAALDDGPVLVQITDAAAGKGEVLVGERSVEFTDKGLVAKVLRTAAR